MSKRFDTAVINDIQSDGNINAEREALLDIFERLMKDTAITIP